MRSILVIDDDDSILTILKHHFKNEMNLNFTYGQSYHQALELIEQRMFDIYIIDLNLEGYSGMNLLRILQKEKNIDNRVILFSSETNDDIKIQGYNLGASNFLEKPLNVDLLRAIIKKNLRMLDQTASGYLQYRNIVINSERRSCHRIEEGKKKEVHLTLIEFNICYELFKAPEVVVSKDQLSFSGKDSNKPISFKSLEMHISSLKRKLGNKDPIKSIRGIGYVLNNESSL